ncbi:hypothetical protein PN36_15475 [Candidatus Thiomargarita nelsonii]|uniref:Uncharacterized protein n=1 Tax=Candidatus Thiomargarita nelsonii TaxID=1003181 RepID=A0A0A6P5K1_9GAMM|nr:hypothetical protein PN36_15475 [Candidatus Thiomargarita nelsonii]
MIMLCHITNQFVQLKMGKTERDAGMNCFPNTSSAIPTYKTNAIKLSFFVGWVELRCTHQLVEIFNNGGFRSTHPTKNP